MAKKKTKVLYKDNVVYVNDVPKLNLVSGAQVQFMEYEGNIVAYTKQIGDFISPRYFIIQADGSVHQRRTPGAVGELLSSTKAFVYRLRKLI